MTRAGWLAMALVVALGLGALAGADLLESGDRARPAAGAASAATEPTALTLRARNQPTTTTRPVGTRAGLRPAPTPTPVVLESGPAAPVLERVPTDDPVVFITIDDGMIRDPAVLAFFEETRLPVTLFLTQPMAAEDEDFWRRMQAAGATIQDHTRTHTDLRTQGYAEQSDEICGTADDFERRFGQRPWLLRPPGGFWDTATRWSSHECGFGAVVLWSASTNDGRLDVGGGRLRPGEVILMHWRNDLAANLRVVVDAAKAAGLTIGRLEDYIAAR